MHVLVILSKLVHVLAGAYFWEFLTRYDTLRHNIECFLTLLAVLTLSMHT